MCLGVVCDSIVREEQDGLYLRQAIQHGLHTCIRAGTCPKCAERGSSEHSDDCVLVIGKVAGHSIACLNAMIFHSCSTDSDSFSKLSPGDGSSSLLGC